MISGTYLEKTTILIYTGRTYDNENYNSISSIFKEREKSTSLIVPY
ncbi:unnamed protein product, partial [Vitis vinifera]|uniref:Uncharacterized protein n=1 Tax=Vitis vinifera TaxID=29760 RepID=D7U4H4_VITVI